MSKLCAVSVLTVLCTSVGWNENVVAEDQVDSVKGVQVLTRGPVHEAFAETVTYDPQPGLVVAKSPPEPIEELPPAQKPEGANVAWIPGYWAWDDERDDFLWVSGTWRALPPGRQWIPGYWKDSDDGSQWTSGYWADAKAGEVQYLPEPPATVEAGPNDAAPSADHIWVPGSWVWNQMRYAWQPGYWAEGQQDWVWTPSHYQWSPRGYVFVNGYYDYSLARRGVLFAPVYFDPSVYARQGFTYSPAMAISTAVFGNHLFLRPNYGHYYFGDYYGSSFSAAGYYPGFSFNSGGQGYDPFYAQQVWQNRRNPEWAKTVQADFQNRVDHEGARPPRTLADQQALLKSGDKSGAKSAIVAMPLDQLAKSEDSSLRFQPVTKQEQQTLAKHGQTVHQFRAERQKLEARGADAPDDNTAKKSEAATAKLPKSPIVATTSDNLGKGHTPPKSHEVPPLDPKVEQKPRSAVAKGDIHKTEPTTVKTTKPVLPKVEAKPTPKTEPKSDAPKAESKPMPKVEPKPVPKAEPKPVPKAEPKPQTPKALPQGEPKPKGN